MTPVVGLVLLSALFEALGGAMQKHGIATTFPAIGLRQFLVQLRPIVASLLRNWVWAAGGLLTLASGALFVQALSQADLSVIVPLAGTSKVFTVAIGVLFLRERMARGEWLAAFLIVTGALLVGLDAGSASDGMLTTRGNALLYAAISVFTGLALALRRVWPERFSPELSLALAGAFQLAAINVLGKAATTAVKHTTGSFDILALATLRALATTPEIYLCILANVLVFVFVQTAFANGRVAIVIPVLGAVSTLTGSLTGFLLLDEQPEALRVIGIAIAVLGTLMLTTRPEASPAELRPAPARPGAL